MKLLCLILPLFSIWSGVRADIFETSKFSPTRLTTLKHCEELRTKRQFQVAKCNAYFKQDTFYLDEMSTIKLSDCAAKMKPEDNGTEAMLNVIFAMKNVPKITNFHVRIINAMRNVHDNYVELVPEVKVYLGPRGSKEEISTGSGRMHLISSVSLAVAEKESLLMAYNTRFFEHLNSSERVGSPTKYLVLNGWHVRNMRKNVMTPELKDRLKDYFQAIIVWVTAKYANQIGKDQVAAPFKDMYLPVVYDMPDSPDIGPSQGPRFQVSSSGFFLSMCVLLYRTFF